MRPATTNILHGRKGSGCRLRRLAIRTVRAVRTHRCVKGVPAFHFTGRKWLPAEDKLLGTTSDREIATLLGRSIRSVLKRRLRLGIPNHYSQVVCWTAAEEGLLGTKPDHVLARQFGRAESTVLQRRRLKHILPFRTSATRRNAPMKPLRHHKTTRDDSPRCSFAERSSEILCLTTAQNFSARISSRA